MSATLYLDSSAWLKLYVVEPCSPEVRALVQQASTIVSIAIAQAEVHAALAGVRRRREMGTEEELAAAERFDSDWKRVHVVEVNDGLLLSAGELAHVHNLRGYDAVQLAGALVAQRVWPDLLMVVFDDDIVEAASDVDVPTW